MCYKGRATSVSLSGIRDCNDVLRCRLCIESNLAISGFNLVFVFGCGGFLVGLGTGTGKLETQPGTPQAAGAGVGGFGTAQRRALGGEENEQPLQNCLLTSQRGSEKQHVSVNYPLDAEDFVPPWWG